MLDNKMVVNRMDINEYPSTVRLPDFMHLTQEEYDLLHVKDPKRIYIIIDAKDRRIYNGDLLISTIKPEKMYLLGPSNTLGEYVLYFREVNDNWEERLIELVRYDDPGKAINALNTFNRVGSHTDYALQIYHLLVNYIQNELSIHELLIGIISLFGYRDDIRLQEVISTAMLYGVQITRLYKRDLPILLREELGNWRKSDNILFQYYASLYDLIVFYDNFKGREFQVDPDKLNLSEIVNEIIKINTTLYNPRN